MKCFDRLPTVDYCCVFFCLKHGCYIISLATIFLTLMTPCILHEVIRCFDQDSMIKVVVYGSGTMYLYSVLVTLYFVYGLWRVNSKHPTITFLLMIVKAMVVTIITAIILLLEKPVGHYCPDGFVLGASTTLDLFLQGYCLVIVNSYRVKEEKIEE